MTDTMQLIIDTANEHLPIFLKEHEAYLNGEKGAYISVLDTVHTTGMHISGEIIGIVPKAKLTGRMTNAIEKIIRLYRRVEIEGYAECTSMVTQDYAASKYGGGIRTISGMYGAASTFPPLYDTLFMAEVFLKCKVIEDAEFKVIMEEAQMYENHGK